MTNVPSGGGAAGLPSLETVVARVRQSGLASIWTVAQKLAATLNNPNTSAMDLQKAVEIDPPLAVRVLRTANSALYGMPGRITSIRAAIVLMGFTKLRELALRTKLGECFAGGVATGAYTRASLWKHSVAVALCARELFRKEFREQGDEAYTAGLLHDVGILAEEQFVARAFAEVVGSEGGTDDTLAREARVFGFTHGDLAGRLLRDWEFPETIARAVACHHDPAKAAEAGGRLTRAVHVADLLCRREVFGYDPIRGDAGEGDLAAAVSALGVDVASLEPIGVEVGLELERMESEGVLA